jgi:putative oxidoreductase
MVIANLTGTHADWVVGVARIVLGIIFFAHGAQKLLGWYGGPGLASSMRTFTEHLHLPPTLAFLVIAGELFSGVGLIVGLFSRIAALVIALTMVGAIATVHFRFGLFLNWFGTQEGHGIEYHLLTIALALVIVVQDAGKFSLDRLLHGHISRLEQSQEATQR